jgi:hypothetical protein
MAKKKPWIKDALSGGKNKGALRKTAMRKGLLRSEKEKLSQADLDRLKKMGGKTAKRAYMAQTLRQFGEGGVYAKGGRIDDSEIHKGNRFGLPNGEVIEITDRFLDQRSFGDERVVVFTRSSDSETHQATVKDLRIFLNNWKAQLISKHTEEALGEKYWVKNDNFAGGGKVGKKTKGDIGKSGTQYGYTLEEWEQWAKKRGLLVSPKQWWASQIGMPYTDFIGRKKKIGQHVGDEGKSMRMYGAYIAIGLDLGSKIIPASAKRYVAENNYTKYAEGGGVGHLIYVTSDKKQAEDYIKNKTYIERYGEDFDSGYNVQITEEPYLGFVDYRVVATKKTANRGAAKRKYVLWKSTYLSAITNRREIVADANTLRGARMIQSKLEKEGVLSASDVSEYGIDEAKEKYFFMKEFYSKNNIPYPPYHMIDSVTVERNGKEYPQMDRTQFEEGEYKYAEGGGVDMAEIEKSAIFYTDESRWTVKPTVEKFETEIRELQELRILLDNKEIRPSQIIGTGIKPQYARKLAYDYLNKRTLVAQRAIEILKNRATQYAQSEGADSYGQGGNIVLGKRYRMNYTLAPSGDKGYRIIEVVDTNFFTTAYSGGKVVRFKIVESSQSDTVGEYVEYSKEAIRKLVKHEILKPVGKYAEGGLADYTASVNQPEVQESLQSQVLRNMQDGVISVSELTKILNKKPGYPLEHVGGITLRKVFLKSFYQLT